MRDPRSSPRFVLTLLLAASVAPAAFAQLSAQQKTDAMESFEVVWRTVRDRHPDPKLNGLDWQAIHDSTRPAIAKAQSMDEVRSLLTAMLSKLSASHYAIIPADVYKPVADLDPAAPPAGNASAGITPAVIGGKAVVERVEPGSPPNGPGVRPGMVLQSVAGTEVSTLLERAAALKDEAARQEARRLLQRSVTRKLNGPPDEPLQLEVLDANGTAKHIEVEREEPRGQTRDVWQSSGTTRYLRITRASVRRGVHPVQRIPRPRIAHAAIRSRPQSSSLNRPGSSSICAGTPAASASWRWASRDSSSTKKAKSSAT